VITDLWFYFLAVPSVLVIGISKGGFGASLGIFGVALMSLSVLPMTAAAILLPLMCVMDILSFWAYRRKWSRSNMRILIPAALAGIVLGALTFRYMNPAIIRILVGFIGTGFSLSYFFRGQYASKPQEANVVRGNFWGLISGFTSFVSLSGGPPLSVYLLPQKLDKSLYVGTTVVYFFILNYAKIIPFALLGQFSTENLTTSLVLSPLVPAGVGLGLWLHKRVDASLFLKICAGLIFMVSVRLLYDGFSKIL